MRLTTIGTAHNITAPIVGRITTTPTNDRTQRILLTSASEQRDATGYAGILTTADAASHPWLQAAPLLHRVRETDHLRNGDVIVLSPNGHVRTLYRPDSRHNTLFITERCNSNCLMCSQPPKDHDDLQHFLAINKAVIGFMDPTTTNLGITGGEPTLLRDDLWELLALLRDRLPRTHIHLLTNGRLFGWQRYAQQLGQVRHPDLTLGIPLYSDVARDHDYIVQARDAFDQTVIGLHHLARHKIQVEIRVVLHKLTIPRLVHLAEYIARNFPFAVHVALMGLEPTGYTPHHRDKLWIDPYDYQDALASAVEYLSQRGMNVSIYNLQRCLLPPALWPFARQSISDWKNIYFPSCDPCTQRQHCAGFFQSAERLHSNHIHPISGSPEP